jgi:autotransporter-associated beta strand protein
VEIPADVEPGGIQVNNNATIYTIASANTLGITGSTSLIKTGNGLLILTSSNIYSGGTMLTSGTLAFGDGALSTTSPITMNGGTLRWHGENIQDISAAITMVAGKTATFDTNGNQVVLNTGIGSSTTASLVKIGAGNLTLGGTGSWSGSTEVLAGTLTAGTNTALGAAAVLIGNGADDSAFMVANRSDISNNVTVSASGTGKATLGGDNSGTGLDAATYAGQITLNRPATIFSAVPSDRLAIDGRITGTVGTLTVTGGSRTTFASTLNDFTGNIVVTGTGTVLQTSVASPAEVIPDASNVTVEAGAFLQLASSSGAETINGLSGAGSVRSYVDLVNPGAIYGSALAVGGANGSASFSGTIVNGNGPLGLTKVGSGTQSLGGFNTYTGNTVVTAGTLHLLDDAALTFKVTDVSHNTLTGTGTITLDGNFAIDVSAVTVTTGSWQLENADTLPGAYGNMFQVVTPDGTPWTDAGNEKWTRSAGTLEFTYNETTGTLTVAEGGFASWIAKAEFGLDPADQQPTDDPDHDGVSNLVEYALDGRNPSVSDGAAGGFASGTLSFAKRPQAAADPKVSYLIQESDDLGLSDVWTEAPAGPTYINTATTISYTLPTGKPKTFARLVVSHAP